jgi:hypothetical protein
MHLATRTCLNCVPRVSSFELPISARPHSSTSGTPLSRCRSKTPTGLGTSGSGNSGTGNGHRVFCPGLVIGDVPVDNKAPTQTSKMLLGVGFACVYS